jgi:hypothetical protein
MHFFLGFTAAFSRVAATFASLGLVLEPSFRIKFLFPYREDEVLPAVFACYGFFLIH